MADKRIFDLTEEGFLDDITDKVYMWLDKKANEGELQEPSWKFKADVFLKILNNFATKFVPNVATVKGKCYWHGGDFFMCNVAYTGDWVPGNFTLTSVDELFARKDALETTNGDVTSLTTYAENVAHSIAPEFDASVNYVKSDMVVYKGTLYVFKNNHSGPWSYSDVSAKNVFNANLINNPDVSVAPYNDLNTFPVNRVVQVSSGASSVSHIPDDAMTGFSVNTIGTNSAFVIQILSGSNKKSYCRVNYGNSWGNWIAIDYLVNNPDTSSAPYNDLNTFPVNRVVQVSSGAGSLSHVPDNTLNSILVYTFGTNSSFETQLVSGNNKKTYIRVNYGNSWSPWIEVATGNSKTNNPNTSSAPYNDLNTFPVNSIIGVSSTGSAVSNKPVDTVGFHVYTYGSDSTLTTQIFSSKDKVCYIRTKFGTSWGQWSKLGADPAPCDVLSAFNNIVCIGDSLTECGVWVSDNASDVRTAYKTYPQVLQTITGATTTSYAKGGDDASDAWNRWNASFEEKTNALAIVFLGTNHGLTDTLATDAPTTDTYTEWASTNTGCYAKIVAKLQELKYKILLIKPYAVSSPGDLSTTQSVVEQIATRFGCSVVGPFRTTEYQYHCYPDRSGVNAVHYNDLGYSWFAHKLVDMVAELGDNLKFIIPE